MTATATYTTTDLYLASFLKARGHKLVNVEREGRRATFVFEENLTVRAGVRDFYNDGLISVRAFTHALQDLRAVVFNW